MASSLATQLLTLQDKSSSQLDLKAQRKKYSRSLLFDPSIAAGQNILELHALGVAGLNYLCKLDSRFEVFHASLFSNQSQNQDRLRMTQEDNNKLDLHVTIFLRRIGPWISNAQALKALEWLIRRFQVQDFNTRALILAFLPYHQTQIFERFLGIIPAELPPEFRFLYPYINARKSISRRTISYAVSHNQNLLTMLCNHMTTVFDEKAGHSALIALWLSVSIRSINQACSGTSPQAIKQHSSHSISLFMLSVLDKFLLKTRSVELRLASYLTLSTLATETKLSDETLDRCMIAVVSGWHLANSGGLLCLSILSSRKIVAMVPDIVAQAVLRLESVKDRLCVLRNQYNIKNLILGIAVYLIRNRQQLPDELARNWLEFFSTNELLTPGDYSHLRLKNHDTVSLDVLTIEGSPHDPVQKHSSPSACLISSSPPGIRQEIAFDLTYKSYATQFLSTVSQGSAVSYLSIEFFKSYTTLDGLYNKALLSQKLLHQLMSFPPIRLATITDDVTCLSFLARQWCTNRQSLGREEALRIATKSVEESASLPDLQAFLPYIFHALGDSSRSVRAATSDMILRINAKSGLSRPCKTGITKQPVIGLDSIYGRTMPLSKFSTSESLFVWQAIVESLEECILNEGKALQVLSNSLHGFMKHTDSIGGPSQSHTEPGCLRIIEQHLHGTPLWAIKVDLMKVIFHCNSKSRGRVLEVMVKTLISANLSFRKDCADQHCNPEGIIDTIFSFVSPLDGVTLQNLYRLVHPTDYIVHDSVMTGFHRRLRTIWTSLAPTIKLDIGLALWASLGSHCASKAIFMNEMCWETLCSVQLSSSILVDFTKRIGPLETIETGVQKAQKIVEVKNPVGLSAKQTVVLQLSRLLELCSVKNMGSELDMELLEFFFQTLNGLKGPSSKDVDQSGYIQSSIMELMIQLLRARSTGHPITINSVHTDEIVDTIMSTMITQVRDAGICLLSELCTSNPESVLHHIMPLFTFLSRHANGQGSEVQGTIAQKAMDTMMPHLISSLRINGEVSLRGASDLIHALVAALPHIQSSRRKGIYRSLVAMLGADKYLHCLTIILLEMYLGQPDIETFAVDLIGGFPIDVILKSTSLLVDCIIDMGLKRPRYTGDIIDLRKWPTRQPLIDHLILLLPHSLTSKPQLKLHRQNHVAEHRSSLTLVPATYSVLTTKILTLSKAYPGNFLVQQQCMKSMDMLFLLVPLPQILHDICSLNAEHSSYKEGFALQMLRALESRLFDNAEISASEDACLELLNIAPLIFGQSSSKDEKLHLLRSLVKILQVIGRQNPKSSVSVIGAILSELDVDHASHDLISHTLHLLSHVIHTARHYIIPIFPLSISTSLRSWSLSDASFDIKHEATNVFSNFIKFVPHMITPTILDQIYRIVITPIEKSGSPPGIKDRIQLEKLIPHHVDLNTTLSAISSTWDHAIQNGPLALRPLIRNLQLAIEIRNHSEIGKHSDIIADLVYRCFDLRFHFSVTTNEDAEFDGLEDTIFNFTLSAIYKMNDKKFRPIFLRMLEKATRRSVMYDENLALLPRLTFYSFFHRFLSSLQSLVTNYCTFAIEDMCNTLRLDRSSLLWNRVRIIILRCLRKALESDQEDILQAPNHFNQISETLLDVADRESLNSDMAQELLVTIAELASASDSRTQLQAINCGLLRHARSAIARVQILAIQCQREITQKMGERWLVLLPEMLPIIGELREDDNEEVAMETAKWTSQIESVLGESVEAMLQ